jgi:hypothetical protein
MNKAKYILTYLYNTKKTVCLASSPRSGSTWVKEMLVSAGKYDCVDEPLRLKGPSGNKLTHAGFAPRTCIIDASYERRKAILSTLEEALKGRVGWLQLSPALRRNLLLKFVRINRILKETVETFDLERTILLVRHPCAVVSSQLAMHGGDSVWSNVSALADDVPAYLRAKIETIDLNAPHKVLALNWAIDQRIPLFDYKPDNTLLVFYENLISNPVEEWERISIFLDIPIPTGLNRPSTTASNDLTISDQNKKWKEKLPANFIRDIVEICNVMGVDIYGCDEKPLYDPWTP